MTGDTVVRAGESTAFQQLRDGEERIEHHALCDHSVIDQYWFARVGVEL